MSISIFISTQSNPIQPDLDAPLHHCRTNVSTKGADMLPKRACNAMKCEVARYVLHVLSPCHRCCGACSTSAITHAIALVLAATLGYFGVRVGATPFSNRRYLPLVWLLSFPSPTPPPLSPSLSSRPPLIVSAASASSILRACVWLLQVPEAHQRHRGAHLIHRAAQGDNVPGARRR